METVISTFAFTRTGLPGKEREQTEKQHGQDRAVRRAGEHKAEGEENRKRRETDREDRDWRDWATHGYKRILSETAQSSCLSPKRGIGSGPPLSPSAGEESKMLQWKTRALALITLASSFAAVGGLSRWW